MATDRLTASPDGTFTALADGRYTVRFERRLSHSVDRVWAAITEPGEIIKWLGAAELEPVEGGSIKITWLNSFTPEQAAEYGIKGMEEGHEESVLNGTITRLDPPRLLEIDSDIFGQMRFELFAEGDGCLLRFSDTFETPPDMLAQSMAGWHMHLDHLERALGGEGVTNWDTWSEDHLDAWAEIRDRYATNTNVPSASSASRPGADGSAG